MTWNAPLVVATVVFFAFLLWKLRPAMGGGGPRAKAVALRAAKERVDAAKTDDERALALCDAGDAAAAGLTGSESAIGYYLRAMRARPQSAELVTRAAKGLARRLGAAPGKGGGEAAARAAIDELARLYAGPLKSARNGARARAMENARALLG
jgi:hypothetical protein